MRTLTQLENLSSEYYGVQTIAEIMQVTICLGKLRAATRHNLNAWKSSISELKISFGGWKTAQEASAKDVATGNKRPRPSDDAAGAMGRKKLKTNPALDMIQSKGKAIPTISASRIHNVEGATEEELLVQSMLKIPLEEATTAEVLPYVISGIDMSWADTEDTDDTSIGAMVNSFKGDFKISDTRTKFGRASRPAVPEATNDDTLANDFMLARLIQFCPRRAFLHPDCRHNQSSRR